MSLEQSVALVTGGGTGIGLACASALAEAGARVVITGRREALLRDAAATIPGRHPVLWRAADMADPLQVGDLVAWVHRELGPVDILVNNAGVNVRDRDLQSLTIEDWDHIMQINANGAFYVIHALLPSMRERGGGLIINISSIAGLVGSSIAGSAYSASKHAVNALTQVITQEEGKNGIRATSICPGAVNTPILDDRPIEVTPEQREKLLQPEDVAAAVMFVATLPPRAHVPELHIVPAN